jgi:ribonuclease HII
MVDGNRCPSLDIPAEAVVKGDGKIASIAAASILAKTVRDGEMLALHAQYPQYGFDRHMGYPTAAHFAALEAHGASPVHRKSFGPVAKQLSLL